MARPENARIEEPAEKVIPITDPEPETAGSPGSVTKRPFVLDKKRGSGGGNTTSHADGSGSDHYLRHRNAGVSLVQGNGKKEDGSRSCQTKPWACYRDHCPGDLVPSDKVKPSPDEAKQGALSTLPTSRRRKRRRSLRRLTPIKRALLTAASSSTR